MTPIFKSEPDWWLKQYYASTKRAETISFFKQSIFLSIVWQYIYLRVLGWAHNTIILIFALLELNLLIFIVISSSRVSSIFKLATAACICSTKIGYLLTGEYKTSGINPVHLGFSNITKCHTNYHFPIILIAVFCTFDHCFHNIFQGIWSDYVQLIVECMSSEPWYSSQFCWHSWQLDQL